MFRVKQQLGCSYDGFHAPTGKGITAAVLDTGIAPHPDFGRRILCFRDFLQKKQDCYDDSGHGTHVCGILAGNGMASGGKYAGIAPDASLVVCKVLDKKGDGCLEDMVKGLEFIAKNRERYGIRILNISIGLNDLQDEVGRRELTERISDLWDSGILVCAAAGNAGPAPMSISPIGSIQKVITVGCNDGGYFGERADLCENYSGRGPSYQAWKKPDIVAPGTDIISCNSHFLRVKNGWKNAYTKKSGTSMATPIVAGAMALYFEKNAAADNRAAKDRLTHTAVDLKEAWSKQGWGMVNFGALLE